MLVPAGKHVPVHTCVSKVFLSCSSFLAMFECVGGISQRYCQAMLSLAAMLHRGHGTPHVQY